MEVLEFVWWRFCGRDFSWEYHVPAFCIPNAQLCGQNLPTLEMKIPKTWMCMNRWRAPPYSEGSEDIIICNDCLAYIGTVHVFYVLVIHVYTYFNCTCLFQAAGGILCCALVLPIWLGFRLLPFVWSPSSCCARASPMLSGVLITCNALRWSWHWHLKPSIHRCSSLEIQWLRDDVSRLSVCVSTHTFETCWNIAEWVVESLAFAYICNGLIAGLNMFETCRVLPFEPRSLWIMRRRCFNPKTCRILLWCSEDLQMPIQASRRCDKMRNRCRLAATEIQHDSWDSARSIS